MAGGIHPPDSVILHWPKSHYNDPVTRGVATVVLAVVLGILCISMVATRLIARKYAQRNFGIDDWFILVAMIPTLGLAVGICLSTQVYDFDRHIWDVKYTRWIPARKSQFANEFLYIWASGLIKISILLFYKRMTHGTFSKTFVYIIWACIAFVCGYIISFTFTLIFSCSPVSAFWNEVSVFWRFDPKAHPYSCVNEPAALLAASAVALTQDVICATLPLALFWSLDMPKRQKCALIGVFLVGYFLVAANAARMYYIYRTFYKTYDVTWESYDIWVWTLVEILLGPMCASAPALKVYFRGLLQDRPWTSWGSRSRSRGSHGWPTDGDEELVEHHNFKADHGMTSHTTSQTAVEEKKPLDSPTLGKDSADDPDGDYFKSVRAYAEQSTRQPSPAYHLRDPYHTGTQGGLSKAERMLGI